MRRVVAMTVYVSCLIAFQTPVASAGIGGLLRRGVSAAAKGSGKLAGKSASRNAARVATKGVTRISTATGKQATKLGAKSSAAVVAPGAGLVANKLGIEGAQLVGRMSPRGSKQLAEISGELAKSPYRRQWMTTLATHGDRAVAWLWKRKGSIFCATAATAIALHPDEFLQAVEATTSAAVSEVAEHVAAPIAKEMAAEAAASFPWHELWGASKVLVALLGCVVLWRWRRS